MAVHKRDIWMLVSKGPLGEQLHLGANRPLRSRTPVRPTQKT